MEIGITFSAFDLFHAGNVKMLEEARFYREMHCEAKGIDLYFK